MYSNTFLFVVFGFVCLPSLTLAAIDLTCNVTVNSSRIIFDPWEVCISINVTESHVHRIWIQNDGSGSRSSTVLAICSKLNGFWFVGQKRYRHINVSCPRKSETFVQMCVNVAHGRETDIGNLSVHIIDETGASKELCYQYLFLEEEEFPKLKSVCIDHVDMEKHTISIDMDFSNISQKDIDTKYMVSAWFGTDFLCEDAIEKEKISCNYKELKNCFPKLTCLVNKEAMWNMTKTSGSSDTSVNITVKIKNLNRNTSIGQNVGARTSCRDRTEERGQASDIGLSWIAIILCFICTYILVQVLMVIVVHVHCVRACFLRKREPSNENYLYQKVQNPSRSSGSEERDEEDGSELLEVIENRSSNDDNQRQDRDPHQDQSDYFSIQAMAKVSNAVKDGMEPSSMESQKQETPLIRSRKPSEDAPEEAVDDRHCKVFEPWHPLQDDESDERDRDFVHLEIISS